MSRTDRLSHSEQCDWSPIQPAIAARLDKEIIPMCHNAATVWLWTRDRFLGTLLVSRCEFHSSQVGHWTPITREEATVLQVLES